MCEVYIDKIGLSWESVNKAHPWLVPVNLTLEQMLQHWPKETSDLAVVVATLGSVGGNRIPVLSVSIPPANYVHFDQFSVFTTVSSS